MHSGFANLPLHAKIMGNIQISDPHSSSVERHDQPTSNTSNMHLEAISEADMARLESGMSGTTTQGSREKKTVYLRCVYTKVGDIDTVRECFEASIYLEAMWTDPKCDRQWNPEIYVDNALGELKQKKSKELIKQESGEFVFLEKHSFKGKFFERMELWHFPFDTQDITVTFCSHLSEDEISLLPMTDKPSRVFTSTFTDEQEWSLHTHVDTNSTTVISDCDIGPRQRPALQFTTRASRRSMFFLVNIWFVSFILCVLAISVFGLSRDSLQGRLQLSFILMLTTVTFKFVIANHIPRISYLTILDECVMINLLFLVLLSIWHAVASLFPNDHPLQHYEKYVIIGFAGLYILAYVIVAIQVYFGAYRRLKLMNEKDYLHKQIILEEVKALRLNMTETPISSNSSKS